MGVCEQGRKEHAVQGTCAIMRAILSHQMEQDYMLRAVTSSQVRLRLRVRISNSNHSISVVLPAYNEEQIIASTV